MINDVSFTGRKIMIVEDDPSSRFYLNQLLDKTGSVILNASNGQEAIEILRSNPDIDLVLMDIQLPYMDGYEAAPKLKNIKKDLILIAQTAFGLLDDRDKILASGFDDYLIKPIFKNNLLRKLGEWLGNI
jgi:CheY-like chemotaxis protein